MKDESNNKLEMDMMNDLGDPLDIRLCIKNLSSNPGAEIVRYGRKRPNILSLGQGESDSPTPDFIAKAANEALADGKTFYGSVLGHDELRQEIANYYDRIYDLHLPTNRIFITNSGSNAMHLALTALLDKGDEVVAVTPIWKNLLGAVEMAQAHFKEVPLDNKDGEWSLTLERLFDACTNATRAILITTPSNPTGWVMSRDEMEAVMEFARSRNIWVISDEVYGRHYYGHLRAPSFLDVSQPSDRLFTVNSFSKAWAMTGWRLGWLIGPMESESPIRDIALYDHMGPPSFTQYGGIAALRYGEDFIAAQMKMWEENRAIVYDFMVQTDRVDPSLSPATFYSFFKVDGEDDCLAFAKRMIDDVALSLAPGCAFGKVGKGYMRLCYAVSKDRLYDALSRLETALKT